MKSAIALTMNRSLLAARLSLVFALTLILMWVVNVGQASGPIIVNSTDDVKKSNDGLCTLREAIIAANADKPSGGQPGECAAGSGADTIILPFGTYVLFRSDSGKEDAAQTGDLDISSDLTITGEAGVVIDASGINDRVFHVLSGNVTISDVTIRNGSLTGDGGGIHNSGVLDLRNATVAGNVARSGGGIHNAGDLTLGNVTLSGNVAGDLGGGIYNAGTLTLNNSTIGNNTATAGGGLGNDVSSAVVFRKHDHRCQRPPRLFRHADLRRV